MANVQGIVLYPSSDSENRIKNQVEGFLVRPLNLRKRVLLHSNLAIYSLPKITQKQVLALLPTITEGVSPIVAKIGKLQPVGSEYVGFSLVSPELINIHNLIVDKLAPIVRGNFNQKYLDQKLSEKELFYLRNYGYHRIKEFFQPHLTIGRYRSSRIRDKELKFAPKLNGKILFNRIGFDNSTDNSVIPATILWQKDLS